MSGLGKYPSGGTVSKDAAPPSNMSRGQCAMQLRAAAIKRIKGDGGSTVIKGSTK